MTEDRATVAIGPHGITPAMQDYLKAVYRLGASRAAVIHRSAWRTAGRGRARP